MLRSDLEWTVKGRQRALEELQEIDAKKTMAWVRAVNERRGWARVKLLVFVMAAVLVGLAMNTFMDGMVAKVGLWGALSVVGLALIYLSIGGLATMRPEDLSSGFRVLLPFEVKDLVEKAHAYSPAANVVRSWVENNRVLREQEQWAVNAYVLAKQELDRLDATLEKARNPA